MRQTILESANKMNVVNKKRPKTGKPGH